MVLSSRVMASSRISVLAREIDKDDRCKDRTRTGQIHQPLSETEPSVWPEDRQGIDVTDQSMRVILCGLSIIQ